MKKNLNEINIEWLNKKSLCVVLCSNGYPENFKKNIEIKNLNKINLIKMNFYFMQEQKKKIKNLCCWWKSFKFCFSFR